jgi:hypothetical protein
VLADDVIAAAQTLRAEATILCEEARAVRAHVVAARRASRFKFTLVRGANDDEIETRVRRCPHCESERVTPTGRVVAGDKLLRISHRCDGCDKPFVYVRTSRDLFDRPEPR